MKLNVKFRNEWFVIPIKEKNLKIDWLVKETIEKYLLYTENKNKKLNQVNTDSIVHTDVKKSNNYNLDELNELLNDVIDIRKNSNNAIINHNDLINDVLENNEFICIVLKSELLEYYEDKNYNNLKNNISTSTNDKEKKTFYLDGYTLDPNDLYQLGSGCFKIDLTETAWKNVKEGRNLLEDLIKDNKIVYGINTGFGKFANTIIDKSDLKQLQLNLIRSHASGVGEILSIPRTRRLLVLRINVLAKGHSGISTETLQSLIKAFNADCLPLVPEQGTVGASGDLAPLSHLALGMIGEGKMWSPSTGWANAKLVLNHHNLTPIELKPKEGIALINGTQLITSLGAEAVTKSRKIAEQADIVAALSIEVLKGTTRAFDPHIHELRPHPGQIKVAEKLRSVTHSEIYHSGIAESHRFCNRVQDAYTLRCCPQVHGIVHETIDFVHNIIKVEMNSATDNPLVIPKLSECISGGNFHGEYPAKACDYLAIGVHELSSMSERRIERLVNTSLSGLPLFLIENGGLCSGLMIPHCTSASLVSENKVYCHPSSIDSLSTSAGTEDHVSMGGFSARKALKVVENVEKVIAIELLAACQAMEFLRPLKSTEPLEKVYELVRSVVDRLDTDRFMAPEIEKVHQLLTENAVYNCVKPYMDNYMAKIKTVKKKISVASRPSSPTTFYSNTYESLHPENQNESEE